MSEEQVEKLAAEIWKSVKTRMKKERLWPQLDGEDDFELAYASQKEIAELIKAAMKQA